MKYTFLLLFLVSNVIMSQSKTPEQIVQDNLDAYNKRDIISFSALLSNDVELYEFQSKEPTAKGITKVKKLYKKLFENSPKLHSTLLKRIIIGNKVIDHESIIGRNGMSDVLELVVIYEVTHQKISKLTVMRK